MPPREITVSQPVETLCFLRGKRSVSEVLLGRVSMVLHELHPWNPYNKWAQWGTPAVLDKGIQTDS